MGHARIILGMMFIAARDRNKTVSLVRFARDGAARDAGVEIERSTTPTRDLAAAWVERAERANETTEPVTYAVRFFDGGKIEGTYALPAVVRMPATTPDEVAFERAAREATEKRDRLYEVAAAGYRSGRALARGKP